MYRVANYLGESDLFYELWHGIQEYSYERYSGNGLMNSIDLFPAALNLAVL